MSTTVHRFRYRRAHRLSGRKAYAAVFDRGKRYFARGLVVIARANHLPYMRLGLSVGKRLGKAVARTRLKRVIREGFRQARNRELGGLDLVVIPRSRGEVANACEVGDRLDRIMKAAHRHLVEPDS